MNRAYALLEVKALQEDRRTFSGKATTPSVDRMGDIVDPLGAKFSNPLPLLHQHDHQSPIGLVRFKKATADGIEFEAEIPQISEPGLLKDRVDLAWAEIKAGLIRAVSIGFRVLDDGVERLKTGGLLFKNIEIFELSAVTVPAQAEATIDFVRSLDEDLLARLGTTQVQVEKPAPEPAPPAAVGSSPKQSKAQEGRQMNKQMTVGEMISGYEAELQAKQARKDEIQTTVAAAGRTKDASEREEFDTLKAEIKELEAEIADLREQEKTVVAKAASIAPATSVEEGSRLRAAFGSVQLTPKAEKGITFTRLLGAKYLAQVNHCAPWDIAKAMFNDTPEVEFILRAAVTPGSTTDSTFAAPLVVLNNAVGEFVELLRAKEVIGRIPGLDRVPFNTQVPRGVTDPTAYWVGQGDVKPLSRPSFDSISLTFAKVAGIVPMTEELMKFSNPSAEMKVRDGLIHAVAYLTDRDFLDPTKAASTGISPASLTNGVTPVTPTGTTADALRDDLGTMLGYFADANEDPSGIVLVMTPNQALKIGLMRNSLGQREFPDITMAGGTLEGFPVITSTNIAATGGSPTDGYPIVAINAPNVYLAEEGVTVDMSREASLQMNDSPDSPETASTVMVSLWQRNMVAIKAERFITWTKKHSTSVQFIQNGKYQ